MNTPTEKDFQELIDKVKSHGLNSSKDAMLNHDAVKMATKRTRVHADRDEIDNQFYALTPQNRAAFNNFRRSLLDEFATESVRERWLANAIASDMWRLDRARADENNIYGVNYSGKIGESCIADREEVHAAACQAKVWLEHGKHIQSLALYQSRVRRDMEKNQKELDELQAERKARHEAALEEAILLVELAQAEGETLDPEAKIESNGFAYSTAEIVKIINRRKLLERARELRAKAKKQPVPINKRPQAA